MILRICSIDCKSGDSPKSEHKDKITLIGNAMNIFCTRVYNSSGLHSGHGEEIRANSSLTSMAAEDLLINDSSNREAVKAVSEGLPQFYVKPALAWWNRLTRIIRTKHSLSQGCGSGQVCRVCLTLLTLIVEPIDAVDGSALMVAPEQEKVLWVFNLVGQEKTDGFQGLFPSVHIVTQEKVVCLWREATILKQPQ